MSRRAIALTTALVAPPHSDSHEDSVVNASRPDHQSTGLPAIISRKPAWGRAPPWEASVSAKIRRRPALHLAGGSADAARAAAPPLSARACARAITLRSTAPSRPNGGHERTVLQQCRSLGHVRACEPCGVWPCQAEFMNCHEPRVMNFVNSEFVNFRRFVNERDQFMNTGVHHARKGRVL